MTLNLYQPQLNQNSFFYFFRKEHDQNKIFERDNQYELSNLIQKLVVKANAAQKPVIKYLKNILNINNISRPALRAILSEFMHNPNYKNSRYVHILDQLVDFLLRPQKASAENDLAVLGRIFNYVDPKFMVMDLLFDLCVGAEVDVDEMRKVVISK
jgi:hypothetical protein